MEDGAARSIARLVSASDRLRGEMSGSLEKVVAANQQLEQLLAGTGANLGQIEATLGERLSALKEAIGSITSETNATAERASTQVDALRALSEGALREAAGLFERLEQQGRSVAYSTRDHTRTLADATRAMEEVEQRVTSTFEARRAGLEEMLAAIAERSERVESTAAAFTAGMEQALRNAEERAQQLGSLMENTARAGAVAIGDQFEQLRIATGQERDRTAISLRSVLEQTLSETGQALSTATDRFRDAAGELRSLTSEVQKELEETRAELRKGVLDIPRETQESTAAMRRVVADQIKALGELASLVRRSDTGLDVARAQPEQQRKSANAGGTDLVASPPRMPQVSAPPQAPVAVSASVLVTPPPRREAPAITVTQVTAPARPAQTPPSATPSSTAPAAQRPATPAPANPTGFKGSQPAAPASPQAPASPSAPAAARPANPAQARPANPAPARTPPARNEQGQARGGWISELLARASRDDDDMLMPASPTPTPAAQALDSDMEPRVNPALLTLPSLGTLSKEIAGMVKEKLADEMWLAHTRGQRGVFTSELYTDVGRERYEDFRRRYQRDPEFRETVDAYLEKFDELLDEIVPGDRTSSVYRSVMTSEEGRVFTMLAHASGRLA